MTKTLCHAHAAALEWAANAIMQQDGGDTRTETGWASDEALAHWITIRAMLGDSIKPPRGFVGGGPTVADPDRPYCKPDQSCCDFACGN